MKMVNLKIAPIKERLRLRSSPRFSLMKFAWRMPKPPRRIANNAAKEIIFNPPSCIRIITTIWPLLLSISLISIRLKPVTQLAEILVNKAVKKSNPLWPLMVISGSIKRPVPMRMSSTKLRTNRVGGLSLLLGNNSPTFPNSKPTMTRK